MVNNSSETTDRFEEHLVNPALLTLARQRGNIDCGGLKYIIVTYGHFYQLIREIKGGHVSICIEPDYNPSEIAPTILDFIDQKLSNMSNTFA